MKGRLVEDLSNPVPSPDASPLPDWHEPIDLAATNSSEVGGYPLELPEEARFAGLPSNVSAILAGGTLFVLGSIGLRYYPRRPGLFRRRLMLGLTCGSFSQTAYNWSQLSERADMAFDKQSEDTAEKKFWRRSLFLYVSESSSGGLSQLRDHHTQVIAALQAPSKRLGYQYQEILSSHRRDERQILLNSSDTRNIVHNATCLLLSDGTGRMVWLALIASMIKGNHPRGDEWPQNPEDYIRVPAYLSFLSHGGDMRETVEMATTAGFYISGAMGLLMRRKFLLRTSLFIGVCSLAANTWLNYYARYFLDAPAYFKDMEMVQWYFESAFIDPSVLLAKGGTKLS